MPALLIDTYTTSPLENTPLMGRSNVVPSFGGLAWVNVSLIIPPRGERFIWLSFNPRLLISSSKTNLSLVVAETPAVPSADTDQVMAGVAE
jgi:hypothetical protein